MGIYIEVPSNHDKAGQLEVLGAERLDGPPENSVGNVSLDEVPEGQVVVCVVQNGPFDAAGIVYDDLELHDFADPTDPRPKTWLTLSREKVLELQPRAKDVLS